MAHTWGTLLDYVQTGRPAYAKVFGRPFWEDLAAHPEIATDFDALMGPAGHGMPDFDVELTGGWDAVRTVVDVGGGTGAMLASLLRRRPQVKGILVDFPGTVARASELLADAGVADRVTLRGQSFFDPLPVGADLYLLKSVLNDWPDEATVAILQNCARAAAAADPPGRIVVLGGVAPDDAPRALGIDMLVAGGKTSTITQFTDLARQAGLQICAAGTQESGRYVVECRPASETADLDETLAQVTRHGGEITDPPPPDGPTRTLATILDPEGNPVGLAGHSALRSRHNAPGHAVFPRQGCNVML
jgi:SAM-dependent methyltransferase